MPNSSDITSTTQVFLDIYDITNDILIKKDGSTALIISVSAMNFGLLAENEQDAIIYAYAGLLNSLNYPIQIVIRSQTKDVTSYLNLLKQEEENATSELRRGWISRYRTFVSELIQQRNVLDKKFYLVVPASALEMGLLPPSTVIPGVKQPDLTTVERSVILEKAREILEPKRDHFLGQLSRIGLFGRQLTTQEIIQLFYGSYNPEAAEGQQITDTTNYTTPLVQASVQGGYMTDATTPSPTATPTTTPSQPTSTPAPSSPASPTAPAPTTTPTAPSAPAPTTPATTPTPTTPPMTPAPESPMPTAPSAPATSGTPEAAAQEAINSTVQAMGSGSTTPPASPTAPAATPSPTMPNPVSPASGAAPAPSSPTPAGSSTDATQATTGDTAKDSDAMAPLPEI